MGTWNHAESARLSVTEDNTKKHHKNQPKDKLSRLTRDTAQLRGCFADDGALTGTACLGRRVGPRAATMCARCSTKLRRGSESFTGWWTGTTRPPALRTRWLHQHRPQLRGPMTAAQLVSSQGKRWRRGHLLEEMSVMEGLAFFPPLWAKCRGPGSWTGYGKKFEILPEIALGVVGSLTCLWFYGGLLSSTLLTFASTSYTFHSLAQSWVRINYQQL